MDTNSKSKDCPECYGQGFAPWMRPIRPGAKLYPVPCETCGGTGQLPPYSPTTSGPIMFQSICKAAAAKKK